MDAAKLDLNKPHLMTSVTDKWPCRSWTFKILASMLGDKQFSSRIAPRTCVQIMETQCSHHEITIKQFCDWMDGAADESNPLRSFTREDNSCYIDYKYMKDMFEDHEEVFEEVQWRDFGLIGFDGYDSTIWLSSEGANTAGHQDTYGFNLISQICGKKLWILFPPEDSQYLYPTRVPYEESSIFTGVNIRRPDPQSHPKFWFSHPVVVTLCAGQTLYVPRHWWHYVESLEPSISINVWVPLKDDIESRLSEAVTRCLATSLMTSLDTSKDNLLLSSWLNPTESLAPTSMNLLLLKTALCQLLEDATVSENSKTKIEEQQGDPRKHKEMNKSDYCELKSLQGLYSNNGRTNDGFTLENSGVNEGLQDRVLTDDVRTGQSDRFPHRSLLSLFAQKMEGRKIINVYTPFQFDSNQKLVIERSACIPPQEPPPKLVIERSACIPSQEPPPKLVIERSACIPSQEPPPKLVIERSACIPSQEPPPKLVIERSACIPPQEPPPKLVIERSACEPPLKKCKLEQPAFKESFQTCSDVHDDKFLTETIPSMVFSFNPCLFDFYLKFLDDLCKQIKCRQCHGGSVVDINIAVNDRNRIVCGAHTAAETSEINVCSSSIAQAEHSRSQCRSYTAFSESVCIPSTQTVVDDKCRKIKTFLESQNEESDKEDINSSSMEDNLSKKNSSNMEEKMTLLGEKHEQNSSTMGDNLNLFGDKHEENYNSSSTFDRPFSQLNQQDVGETLLNCVLHPDVVKMISELFKEQCQGRLRQKLKFK